MSPVSPDERIKVGDVLCFSGIVGTIIDAQKIRGLEPVDHALTHEPSAAGKSRDVIVHAMPRTGLSYAKWSSRQLRRLLGRA